MSEQDALPGLGWSTGPADGPMVKAAHATLEALRRLDKVGDEHALLVQLIVSLAGAIDQGVIRGRASAVAMASKELREALLQLDPPDEGGGTDAQRQLADFLAKLEAAANNGGVLPA